MIRTLSAVLAISTSVVVAAPATAQTREFNIPAGSLRSALDAFARQSGRQVVYRGDEVRSLRSPGVRGTHSPEDALNALVARSGFVVRADRTGAFAVVKRGNGQVRDSDQSSVGPRQVDSDSAASNDENREIIVVGTRLGDNTDDSAQPTKVITAQQIERSGAISVSQLLNRLPEVSFSSDGSVNNGFSAGVTTVRLRGYPAGTTAILINGRPAGSSALVEGVFDLSTIPLEFTERVEVLPAGSSAIYGGDGLGGVVNLVLKRDLNGINGSARYSFADSYDEKQVALSAGKTWSRGSLAGFFGYTANSALSGLDREISANQDYRRFGGPDSRVTFSNPGTITSLTTANLPGLNSRFAGVPVGSTGVGLTPSSFLATQGIANLTSFNGLYQQVSPSTRYSLFVVGRYNVSDNLEAFAEMLFTHRSQTTSGPPLVLPPAAQIIPASNAFNPFGIAVRGDFLLEVLGSLDFKNKYFRPLIGLRGEVGEWKWEASARASWDNAKRTNTTINAAAAAAAVASSNPATAINVFQDGPGGTPEFIASLINKVVANFSLETQAVDAFARGPLLSLPAGQLMTVFGGEFVREKFESDGVASGVSGRVREHYAAFAEARIPLLGDFAAASDEKLATATGAIRYDHYNDFGGHFSTGFGLEIRPVRGLLLRGSFSQAFKPPTLTNLYRSRVTSSLQFTDPALGVTYVTQQLQGGNPDLEPQTGKSYTAGFVISQPNVSGLRLAVTGWKTELENGITNPSVIFLRDNPGVLPGRIVRDPVTNRVTLFDVSPVNFGFIKSSGIDASLGFRFRTGIGTFSPSVSATRTLKYQAQATPGGVIRDGLGFANASGFSPKWKATGGFTFTAERLPELSVSGRYIGPYSDYAALPNGTRLTLGDVVFVDANAKFALPDLFGGTRRPSLSVGAINLLNKLPDYSNNASFGYDSSQYDIRGRIVYVRLGVDL